MEKPYQMGEIMDTYREKIEASPFFYTHQYAELNSQSERTPLQTGCAASSKCLSTKRHRQSPTSANSALPQALNTMLSISKSYKDGFCPVFMTCDLVEGFARIIFSLCYPSFQPFGKFSSYFFDLGKSFVRIP